MTRIDNLFDNNYNSQNKSLKDLCSNDFNEYAKLRNDLLPFSGKKIIDLQSKNPNLIIFPHDIQDSKDQIQDSVLYSLDNEYTDNPEETEITTSNLMGFFGIKGTEIHIHSRFDEEFKNDNFLHYMLSKVFFPNVVSLPHSTKDDGNLNLLIFAFPILLKNALKQGIIKEYVTKEYNNPNVRGVLDISRHIKLNIPFNGNIAYKTREHNLDNFTTQLIRHTIEFIKTTEFGAALLEQDQEINESVNIINQITPTYSRNDRQYILGKNLNPKTPPYFSDYLPLQKLCIQILRYEYIDFSGESEGLYGIIFDGAWLWEEYLNIILSDLDLVHAENKNQSKGIRLFSDRRYLNYPDFYKTGKYILDAKYKKITKDEELKISIDSSDYHQMITYMRVQDAPVGGFVYPLPTKEYLKLNQDDLLVGTLNGEKSLEGKIYHFPMQIPQVNGSFEEYKKIIISNEERLINIILKIIRNDK